MFVHLGFRRCLILDFITNLLDHWTPESVSVSGLESFLLLLAGLLKVDTVSLQRTASPPLLRSSTSPTLSSAS